MIVSEPRREATPNAANAFDNLCPSSLFNFFSWGVWTISPLKRVFLPLVCVAQLLLLLFLLPLLLLLLLLLLPLLLLLLTNNFVVVEEEEERV